MSSQEENTAYKILKNYISIMKALDKPNSRGEVGFGHLLANGPREASNGKSVTGLVSPHDSRFPQKFLTTER